MLRTIAITVLLLALTATVQAQDQTAPSPAAAVTVPQPLVIRTEDDPAREQREREALEIQRRATVATERATEIADRAAGISDRATNIADEALKTSNRATEIAWWAGVTGAVQLAFTVLSLGAVVYTLRLNRRATEAAIDANRQMRDMHDNEQRAWLVIDHASLFRSGPKRRVTIRVKNIGNSPARDVRLKVMAMLDDISLPTAPRVSDFAHQQVDRQGWDLAAGLVFPTQDRSLHEDDFPIDVRFAPPKSSFLRVVYCVLYRTGLDTDFKVTAGEGVVEVQATRFATGDVTIETSASFVDHGVMYAT